MFLTSIFDAFDWMGFSGYFTRDEPLRDPNLVQPHCG